MYTDSRQTQWILPSVFKVRQVERKIKPYSHLFGNLSGFRLLWEQPFCPNCKMERGHTAPSSEMISEASLHQAQT